MKIKLISFLLLCVAFFSLEGCSSSSEKKDYGDYVSGNTSGVISRFSNVVVSLATAPTHLTLEEKDGVLKNVFEFSPEVQGVTFWVDDNTIAFKPSQPFVSGKDYKATFHLSKVAQIKDDSYEDFVFDFSVRPLEASVVPDFPIVLNDGSMDVHGKVIFSDKIEQKDLKDFLSASVGGNDLEVMLGQLGVQGQLTILPFSVNVPAQTSKSTLLIKWDCSKLNSTSKGEVRVDLPNSNIFEFVNHKIVSGENAHIELYFSQPLDESQKIESFCYFKDGSVATYTFDGSVLNVFPKKVFNDSKQLLFDSNIKSYSGKTLQRDTMITVEFSKEKPQVSIVGNGAILPTSEGVTLPFRAVNLKAVDVTVFKINSNNILQFLQVNDMEGVYELYRVGSTAVKKRIQLDESALDLSKWHTFALDLSKIIDVEPNAIYNVSFSFSRDLSLYPCDEEDGEDSDDEYYYDYDNPCKKSYYYRSVYSNVFVSDIGIIAKGGDNSKLGVFVTDIKTSAPISGATVEFYSFAQQLLSTTSSGSDGYAEYSGEEAPAFVKVINGNQTGYLRVGPEQSLSFSSFDVGGASYVNGLKGYIYGERGVWRPGDTLFLTFVLQDLDKTLPESHPIEMELVNSRGAKHSHKVQKYKSGNYVYCFAMPTSESDPTGTWSAHVNLGNTSFSKNLFVETVKPNRMKVALKCVDGAVGSSHEADFKLTSAWLHGGKASNKKFDVTARMFMDASGFESYPKYTFSSKNLSRVGQEVYEIAKGSTDENGESSFAGQFPKLRDSYCKINATLTTRVFEGTGEFSTNYSVVKYSPYSSYVGLKMTNEAPTKSGYYYTGKDNSVSVVRVDEDGKPLSSGKIKYTVYKTSWRWWWDSSNDEDYAYYANSEYLRPVRQGEVNLTSEVSNFTLNFDDDNWGRYVIIVEDVQSGHRSAIPVLFDWESSYGRTKDGNPSFATMLSFSTDKENYKVGEKVKLTIPAPQGGRALVSIENRSRVISYQWVEVPKGKSEIKTEVEVTNDMFPNFYVTITLLQPYGSVQNDLPIRLYGSKNIMVEDESTVLHPQISMPNSVQSEKPFEVKVSEANGKEMEYTLAIVDEGLLDLTDFKTPNPHNDFYVREALGVRSWDLYDYVIGAYGGVIEKLFSIGGDMSLKKSYNEGKESRFTPIVKFLGPCKLKAGKSETHKITLPPYFGAVRVMVVASTDRAYGNAEKSVKVAKPIMTLATLPRVAGVDEEISLPVSVFSTESKKRDVEVSVSAGDVISVVGNSKQSVSFADKGEKVVYFKLKAGKKLGLQKINIEAKSGSDIARFSIPLEVRNANPIHTDTKMFSISPKKSMSLSYALFGMEGTNDLAIEVSSVPSINLDRFTSYLIGYPHGCAEQTTSKGFPQLFMPSLCDLSAEEISNCERNVKSTINKLVKMQLSSGAVAYWLGGSYSYPWVTSYAGHFMIEAKRCGYDVPSFFLTKWAKYQKESALAWSRTASTNEENDLTQAYRLYTLALYGKAELGAMNRLKEDSHLSQDARWRLAAAYATCGYKNVAKELLAKVNDNDSKFNLVGFDYNFGSKLRNDALILETTALLGDQKRSLNIANYVSKQLNTRSWCSTQEIAYCLLSMYKFSNINGVSSELSGSIEMDGNVSEFNSRRSLFKKKLSTKREKGSLVLKNNADGMLFATLTTKGAPIEDSIGTRSEGIVMSVNYYDMKDELIDVNSLKQGTDFYAIVNITNKSGIFQKEISVSQIIPSGWEIINYRMDGGNMGKVNYNYQDIRDDRVLTYFSIPAGKTVGYRMYFNAAYRGKFRKPAVVAEAMYDGSVYSRTSADWVIVKE